MHWLSLADGAGTGSAVGGGLIASIPAADVPPHNVLLIECKVANTDGNARSGNGGSFDLTEASA